MDYKLIKELEAKFSNDLTDMIKLDRKIREAWDEGDPEEAETLIREKIRQWKGLRKQIRPQDGEDG